MQRYIFYFKKANILNIIFNDIVKFYTKNLVYQITLVKIWNCQNKFISLHYILNDNRLQTVVFMVNRELEVCPEVLIASSSFNQKPLEWTNNVLKQNKNGKEQISRNVRQIACEHQRDGHAET